jgi:hypothetical protein
MRRAGLVAWIVWIEWRGGWPVSTSEQRIQVLAYAMYGSLATAAITITALGMAINRRTVKVDGPGDTSFEVSGGQDDAPVATVTTTTEVTGPNA